MFSYYFLCIKVQLNWDTNQSKRMNRFFQARFISKMQDNCVVACSPNRRDTTGGVAATSQLSWRWTSACPTSEIAEENKNSLRGREVVLRTWMLAKSGNVSRFNMHFGTKLAVVSSALALYM